MNKVEEKFKSYLDKISLNIISIYVILEKTYDALNLIENVCNLCE